MAQMLLQNTDTRYLDRELLSPRGLIDWPPSALELSLVPHEDLLGWCGKTGRYTIPTLELVAWLRKLIGDRSAIEICAGHGELGRALGIPITDSYLHAESPFAQLVYKLMQQSTTKPPSDVQKMDALDAVAKFRPKVVIGSYVTQLWRERDPDGSGSMYGVDEEALWRGFGIETYVHIGNIVTHGKKKLRKHKHETHYLPFLYGRGFIQKDNVVFVWSR